MPHRTLFSLLIATVAAFSASANTFTVPVLELHDGQGTSLASDDDWQEMQKEEIEATGLAPSDPAESALLRTLGPGNYTAIVSGKNGTVGVALVETYHLH